MFAVQKAVYILVSEEDESVAKLSSQPIEPKEGYIIRKSWQDVVTADYEDTCEHAQKGMSFWETRIVQLREIRV